MAQLVCLQAIFRGNDNLDQLEQIFELTGVPDVATLTQMGCTESMKELLEWCCFFLYWESFHQDVLARLQQLPNYPPQDFNVRFALGHEHPRATARTQLTSEGTQTYRWIYYILFGFFSGIQFLRYLLDVDPSKRPSAAEAIGKYFQAEKEKRIFCLFLPVAHPYLTSLHEPVDEPVTEVLNDPHSNENHSINTWKSKLTIFYFEIFSFFCLDIIWTMVEEFLPPSWITEDSSEDE